MRSKNKPRQTAAEAAHAEIIASMDCVVCDHPPPSEVHEPEQGLWFVSMPLCPLCHRGPDGLAEFLALYRAYRKFHPRRYSLERAYQIAFQGLPF